jgi:hypothetical protein
LKKKMSFNWKASAGFVAIVIALAATFWWGGIAGQNSPANNTGSTNPTTGAGTPANVAATSGGLAIGPGNVNPAPAQPADPFVTRTKAIEELLGTILKNFSWAIVALVAIVLFRKQLMELLEAITGAMADRGVSVDIGTLKLQVTEGIFDASDDRPSLLSLSPFDLDGPSTADRLSTLKDISEQLTFQVSDYEADRWVTTNPAHEKSLNEEHSKLVSVCANSSNFADVKDQLAKFAIALERSRFLKADKLLLPLLQKYPDVLKGIQSLTPSPVAPGETDYLILHAAGTAYAQAGIWESGKALLDKIAWKDRPIYLPAGDEWLACAYHEYIEKSLKSDAEQRIDLYLVELLKTADDLLEQGDAFSRAMEEQKLWDEMPSQKTNQGYYKREIHKVLGTIAGIVAEYAETSDIRTRYLKRGEEALRKANSRINGEEPSPLDHNNLADLYRQRGKYAEAHDEMRQAFEDPKQIDSTFYHTEALIFWKEKEPLKGIQKLQEYTETCVPEGSDQDLDQYMDNQILAAKLAVTIPPALGTARLVQVADILERARQFLSDRGSHRKDAIASRARAEVDELLGFTYLSLSGNESLAVEAFERFHDRGSEDPTTQIRWRRALGRATALTRLARAQRRKFSAQVAAQHREGAANILLDCIAELKVFGLERNVPRQRRTQHLLLHLNTVVVLHGLAQETFYEGEIQSAQDLVNQQNLILTAARQSLNADEAFLSSVDADAKKKILDQMRLSEAQRSFLLGLILIQADPEFSDTVLLSKAETNFTAARGINAEFDCMIDLVVGEMYLAAASAAKGDVPSLYRYAVQSFELATTRDAPALRGEVIRALTDAYARRNTVLRKAKTSKPAV